MPMKPAARCILTAGGGRDGSGRAHLTAGALPAAEGEAPPAADLHVTPEGCTARFTEDARYTADGCEFCHPAGLSDGADAQYVTVQAEHLPEVVFAPAG